MNVTSERNDQTQWSLVHMNIRTIWGHAPIFIQFRQWRRYNLEIMMFNFNQEVQLLDDNCSVDFFSTFANYLDSDEG